MKGDNHLWLPMATYGHLPRTIFQVPPPLTTTTAMKQQRIVKKEKKISLFISILFRITNYNQINKTKINKLLDFHVFIFLYFYIVFFFFFSSSFSTSINTLSISFTYFLLFLIITIYIIVIIHNSTRSLFKLN